jgi:hypothetical protein
MSKNTERTTDLPEDVQAKLDIMPVDIESGEAEIRLIDHKRTGSITVRGYIDPRTGEDIRFLDQYGKDRVVRFTRNKTYDLSNLNQRLEYFHVMNHPLFVTGPTPVLIVVNHETDAESAVLKKDTEADANAIVRKLKGEELRDFSRVMLVGKRIAIGDRTSDAVIKRALYETIEEDPSAVIREWENPDRTIKQILRKGLHNRVFIEKDGVYSFGTQRMGITFDQAVEWLKENEDILPNIRKQINSKK